jgi:HSP20 family protein
MEDQVNILNTMEVNKMSNLTRYDPFSEMLTLRNAMDRLFDSAFVGPSPIWQSETMGVAVDVMENADALTIKAAVPGMKPEDLEITYNNNVLTIKGEIKEESETEDARYHVRERRIGTFSRSFSLPVNVNPEAIQAKYTQGILTLTLLKTEEAKPKRIAVQNTQPAIEAKISDRKN